MLVGRIGVFQRDLGDGEHAEIMISESAVLPTLPEFVTGAGYCTDLKSCNFRSVPDDIQSNVVACRTESSSPCTPPASRRFRKLRPSARSSGGNQQTYKGPLLIRENLMSFDIGDGGVVVYQDAP
jgi:hypothetical protein